MNLLAKLNKQNKVFGVVVGSALIVGVGLIDYVTGYEFAFSLFYLIPISLVTWVAGRRLGIAASLASAMVWLVTDVAAGHSYSRLIFYVWNSLIELSFFVIVTVLHSALQRALEHERAMANTDYLTTAMNSRFFFNLVQKEINRAQRYKRPFTLTYIDIDNFKTVNDRFGHMAGDQVLRSVVKHARKYLRKTDVVARLGGDEFALLLPETGQESAQVVLSKIQHEIVQGMHQSNWSITISAGVLTCINAPHTSDEIIGIADDLMYSVKRENKNGIKYSIYAG